MISLANYILQMVIIVHVIIAKHIQQYHYEELEINYIIYWVEVEIAYLQWAFQATDNICHANLFAGHMARRPLTHHHW
jgi:hypothetical protein